MTEQQLSDSEIDYRLALRTAARNYNRTLVASAVIAVGGFIGLAVTVGLDAGILFVVGVGLGIVNSQLVQRSLARAVTSGHTDRKAIGFGVLRRLSLITVVALLIAFVYQPYGWMVFAGLTIFQMLIMATVLGGLARQVRQARHSAVSGHGAVGPT